jgi:hypothetical protein
VKHILDEMLAPSGASLACVPSSKYCRKREHLTYFQVAIRCQEFGDILVGYLEPDEAESTGFKPPLINSKEKGRAGVWDGFVCCVLSGKGS